MKKHTLRFALLLIPSFFLFKSNQGKIEKFHPAAPPVLLSSANPPAAKTGAPGETTCTSCHTGTTQSASGIIDLTFSGAGNEYIVGQDYTFTISIATGTKNGFEATILDASDAKAGTFTSGTNYSVTNSGVRQYVRHNTSSGITSWTFNWTAPDTDMGDLTLYFSFNKSNASGSSSGDIIYLGQFNITSAVFNTVTEYEKTDETINLWYNAQNQTMNMDYVLFEPSLVMLSVQNLSGELVLQQNLGLQDDGNYQDVLSLTEKPAAGIYVVSLFAGNSVYNRKIYVP